MKKKKKIKRRKKKCIFPLFLDYYALFFNIFSFLSCLKKSLVLKGANCHCQLTYEINEVLLMFLIIRDGGRLPPQATLCHTRVRVGCFRVLHYHTFFFSISHEAGI